MNIQNVSKYKKELMGFAALWIIYFHAGPEMFLTKSGVLREFGWFFHRMGFVGVDMFIFLAGIGIVYSLNKKGQTLGKFYLTRILRVYPVFAVLCIYRYITGEKTWSELWKNLTFYSNYGENMFDMWWYVAAIMVFYLCAPLFYWVYKKMKHAKIFLVICMAVSMLGTPLYIYFERTDFQVIVQRIPIFLLGIGFGELLRSGKEKVNWIMVVLLFLVGTGAEYYVSKVTEYEIYNGYPLILMASTLCILLANLFALIEKVSLKCILAPLGFIGECSLEFYLLQENLLGEAVRKVAPFADMKLIAEAWANFGLLVFLCAACGALLARIFDFSKLLRKRRV